MYKPSYVSQQHSSFRKRFVTPCVAPITHIYDKTVQQYCLVNGRDHFAALGSAIAITYTLVMARG